MFLTRADGLRLALHGVWNESGRMSASIAWKDREGDYLPRGPERPATEITMAVTKTPAQLGREIARRLVAPCEACYAEARARLARDADLAAANMALAKTVAAIIGARPSANQNERDLARGGNVELYTDGHFPAFRVEVGDGKVRLRDLTLPGTPDGLNILARVAALARKEAA